MPSLKKWYHVYIILYILHRDFSNYQFKWKNNQYVFILRNPRYFFFILLYLSYIIIQFKLRVCENSQMLKAKLFHSMLHLLFTSKITRECGEKMRDNTFVIWGLDSIYLWDRKWFSICTKLKGCSIDSWLIKNQKCQDGYNQKYEFNLLLTRALKNKAIVFCI